jgi:hypothetical protein
MKPQIRVEWLALYLGTPWGAETRTNRSAEGQEIARADDPNRVRSKGGEERRRPRPPQSFVFLYDHKFKGHKLIGPPGQYTLVFYNVTCD